MEGVDILPHERSKTQFDVDAMKIVWAGSRHAFEVSDRMARLVASDPVFFFLFFLWNWRANCFLRLSSCFVILAQFLSSIIIIIISH